MQPPVIWSQHLRPDVAEVQRIVLFVEPVFVVLFGHDDPSWNVPVCPPVITDMRSRTPTVVELAVWLRAVDVVVCHDSFLMHLAGALKRPTVGLFAPTSRTHASRYQSVSALASTAVCSPCHQTAESCPRGLERCVAWDESAVQPDAVVETIVESLRKRNRLPSPAAARAISVAM